MAASSIPPPPPRAPTVQPGTLAALWAAGGRRVAAFLLLFLVLLTVVSVEPVHGALAAAGARLLGDTAEFVLSGTRFAPAHHPPYLWAPGASDPLVITGECVALPAFATLAALELAVGRGWLARGLRALTISLLYWLLNSFRIVTLVVIMHEYPQLMTVFHEYAWNAAQFVIVTTYVVYRLSARVDGGAS